MLCCWPGAAPPWLCGHLVHRDVIRLHLSVMLVPVMFCDAMQPALAQGLTANDGHQGALFGPLTRYSSSGSCRVRLCTFALPADAHGGCLVSCSRATLWSVCCRCRYQRGGRQQLHSIRKALRLGVGGCSAAGIAPHRAIEVWHSNPAPQATDSLQAQSQQKQQGMAAAQGNLAHSALFEQLRQHLAHSTHMSAIGTTPRGNTVYSDPREAPRQRDESPRSTQIRDTSVIGSGWRVSSLSLALPV